MWVLGKQASKYFIEDFNLTYLVLTYLLTFLLTQTPPYTYNDNKASINNGTTSDHTLPTFLVYSSKLVVVTTPSSTPHPMLA